MGVIFYAPPARPRDESGRMEAVFASGLLDAAEGARLREIVWDAAKGIGTMMAAISVISGDRQVLVATFGMERGTTQRSTSFCGHAILTPDRVLCVPDATRDERFAGNPLVVEEPGLRFYAGVPLVAPGGHALGALCVIDRRARNALTPPEERLLRRLAERVVSGVGTRPGAEHG